MRASRATWSGDCDYRTWAGASSGAPAREGSQISDELLPHSCKVGSMRVCSALELGSLAVKGPIRTGRGAGVNMADHMWKGSYEAT